MTSDNIKFFVPLDSVSKAKDSTGKDIMRLGGIASTSHKDSDGEFLDPNGFELDSFKKSGFINWHHIWKDKPKALIGIPSKAEIRPEGFYVEADLWSQSELAKEVYDLAEILKANGDPNRRLGFSVEGKVLKRGSTNEKHPDYKKVLKARITQVAITPTPKNSNTFADIIKGEYSDFKEEYDMVEKGSDANGGSSYIIDVERPSGERVTVDKDLNIKITKALTTAQDSGGPLKRESLDGKVKDQMTCSPKKGTLLSKSEAYERIYSEFYDLDSKRADQIFTLIEHFENLKS